MSTLATKKIHLISICELGMPKICCAKKPTFGNLDSLATHHINGSRKSTFSTCNLWNKGNLDLRRHSIACWLEAIAPNNPHELEGCYGGGDLGL